MNEYDDKEYIRQLQEYLYYISLFDPSIPRIAVDGIYGKQTKNAVSAFQKEHGLKITGEADIKTWNLIKYEYEKIMQSREAPDPLCVFPSFGYVVYTGEKSAVVSFIQLVLECIGSEYGFGQDIKITGEYTDTDATAVKKLQKIHGLEQTGAVDCTTWNCMASDYKMFCSIFEYKR